MIMIIVIVSCGIQRKFFKNSSEEIVSVAPLDRYYRILTRETFLIHTRFRSANGATNRRTKADIVSRQHLHLVRGIRHKSPDGKGSRSADFSSHSGPFYQLLDALVQDLRRVLDHVSELAGGLGRRVP